MNKTKKDFKEVKRELERLKEENYKNYIKSILSIEKCIEDEKMLDYLYDRYMDNDDFSLLNEEFEFLAEDMELEIEM